MFIHDPSTSLWLSVLPSLECTLLAAISPIRSVTAGCYLTLALLLGVRWHRLRTQHPQTTSGRPAHGVWILLACFVVLLGLNTLTDGFERFAHAARGWADATGLYEHRRPVQAVVSVMIAVTMLGLIAHVLRVGCTTRDGLRQRRKAAVLAILAALVAFTCVRSISLHHIDSVLNMRIGPLAAHHLVEISMLLLLATVCLLPPNPRSHSRGRSASPSRDR